MAPLRRHRHSCQNILRLSTNICSISCKQRFVPLKLERHNTGRIGTEEEGDDWGVFRGGGDVPAGAVMS